MPSLRVTAGLTDSSPNPPLDTLATPVQNTLECDAPISEGALINIQTAIQAAKLTYSNPPLSQERNADEAPDSIRGHLASGIRRVPLEILIQIFLQSSDVSRRSPHWSLSHVCSLWRELALRTPQLWTRVPLPLLSDRIRVAEALVSFLPEYLSRSKDQSISFNWEGNWDPDGLEEEDRFEDPICGQSNIILDLLIQHAERWGSVSLISGRWTPKFEYQLSQLQSRLTRLHHLELGVNNSHVMYNEVFQDAPQLVEVKLHTPINPNDSERIREFIHWDQLLSLKLTILSSSILPHLDLCHNLVELDLEYAGSEIATFGPSKLELPHLKSLSLRSPSDLSSNHFELLSFPHLQDFRVFSILAEPEPFGSFLHFLNRHGKSLQRLTIGHIRFMYFRTSRPETRIDFTSLPFGSLRHLGYLQLHRPPLDKLSAFLKAIAHDMLPQLPLHTLHIIFNDTTRLSHAYIKQVSQELRAVGSWAETVHLGTSRMMRRIIINPGESNDYWEFLAALEGWPEEYHTDEMVKVFKALRGCEKTLQDIYPVVYDNEDRVIVTVFDEEETRRIRECLGVMMAFGDVEEVHFLYNTRVHFIARALGNLSSDQFTPNESHIAECALSLINEWKPLFGEDVQNRRWMHQGSRKLVYMPVDDDLHRSNVEYWMYGLKPEWETEEVNELF